MSWLALDMDDGVLREFTTRKQAVSWAVDLHGSKILERHTYGPGRYSYVIGFPGEDRAHTVFIETREMARTIGGWDVEQEPLYPLHESPFERVEREE